MSYKPKYHQKLFITKRNAEYEIGVSKGVIVMAEYIRPYTYVFRPIYVPSDRAICLRVDSSRIAGIIKRGLLEELKRKDVI